ncbi:hypothetical protein T10_8884, partial [Trichinella papuae]
CEKRLFRKFSRKSPSEHPKSEKRLFRKFSGKSHSEHPISAKNDFSGNFHENRPV